MTKLSDEWQTPQWLFDELNDEFNFDIDLCATKENSKCDLYCSDHINNHTAHISGNSSFELSELFNTKLVISAFMNPPYSNPKPFIEKAWEDSKHCKIVCLVKCDPSTRWWATFWDYESKIYYNNIPHHRSAGPKPGCSYPRFFPKRIQFDPPQQLIDSGEVWKVGNKWVRKCNKCYAGVLYWDSFFCKYQNCFIEDSSNIIICVTCKGEGYKPLSGPTFPCALLIFDRRGV